MQVPLPLWLHHLLQQPALPIPSEERMTTRIIAGALSSASIYGAWRKNFGGGIRAGILMSIVAHWH